jgi:hypothetical protein
MLLEDLLGWNLSVLAGVVVAVIVITVGLSFWGRHLLRNDKRNSS